MLQLSAPRMLLTLHFRLQIPTEALELSPRLVAHLHQERQSASEVLLVHEGRVAGRDLRRVELEVMRATEDVWHATEPMELFGCVRLRVMNMECKS